MHHTLPAESEKEGGDPVLGSLLNSSSGSHLPPVSGAYSVNAWLGWNWVARDAEERTFEKQGGLQRREEHGEGIHPGCVSDPASHGVSHRRSGTICVVLTSS